MEFFENFGSSSTSLVLENERGEIVMNPAVHKVDSEEKALIALRNHSEAERRRRERINGHLATLRCLVPGTAKMDKAALLAQVINQVKELKLNVAEISDGTLVPTDMDELRVEEQGGLKDGGGGGIRASLCCEFKQELLLDLREALEGLPLKTVKAEMATFGGRMVNVFLISGSGTGGDDGVTCVYQALRSVLDKFYASEEFTSRNSMGSKRRRISFMKGEGEGDGW